ncbi:MAG: hypothetical protein MJE77_03890 [Proteobacteria bacterium]|nr:hypothetical protein [Pseudomonadota bacterium]
MSELERLDEAYPPAKSALLRERTTNLLNKLWRKKNVTVSAENMEFMVGSIMRTYDIHRDGDGVLPAGYGRRLCLHWRHYWWELYPASGELPFAPDQRQPLAAALVTLAMVALPREEFRPIASLPARLWSRVLSDARQLASDTEQDVYTAVAEVMEILTRVSTENTWIESLQYLLLQLGMTPFSHKRFENLDRVTNDKFASLIGVARATFSRQRAGLIHALIGLCMARLSSLRYRRCRALARQHDDYARRFALMLSQGETATADRIVQTVLHALLIQQGWQDDAPARPTLDEPGFSEPLGRERIARALIEAVDRLRGRDEIPADIASIVARPTSELDRISAEAKQTSNPHDDGHSHES